MRAMTSGAPPAPVVTISLTGAVGKVWADAGGVDDCGGEQHQGPKQTHVRLLQLIFFAVSAITGRQICCCSRMKAVSSSGVVGRM